MNKDELHEKIQYALAATFDEASRDKHKVYDDWKVFARALDKLLFGSADPVTVSEVFARVLDQLLYRHPSAATVSEIRRIAGSGRHLCQRILEGNTDPDYLVVLKEFVDMFDYIWKATV